jgi:hypothetical protein
MHEVTLILDLRALYSVQRRLPDMPKIVIEVHASIPLAAYADSDWPESRNSTRRDSS